MNFETAVLVGVLIGPALYVLDTIWRAPASTYEGFHFGGRNVAPSDFVDSTTVYALQVAAITLFASWGYFHGLWALLVPVFWAAGYLFVVILIKQGVLDRLIQGNVAHTLHQYIARSGRKRWIAAVAALITLVGLAGPAMFEAKFVADLVGATLDPDGGGGSVAIFFMVGFIFFGAVYMIHSGFAGVILTDKIQLAIGYSGFVAVFAILLVHLGQTGNGNALPISLICFALSIIILASRFWLDWRLQRYDWWSYIAVGFGVVGFGAALAFILTQPVTNGETRSFFAFIGSGFREPFSWLALISLAIANGLYQIVDVGHWQRLLSINVGEMKIEDARRTMAASTTSVGIYSPATWAMAVMLGVTLSHILPDGNPWLIINELMASFHSDAQMGPWLGMLFMLSLTAIMFSTMDSLISATAFTLHNDILGPISERLQSIGIARLATIAVLLLYPAYYLVMQSWTDTFDAILYFSWSCQIALLPSAIMALVGRSSSAIAILASFVLGILAAAIPLIQGTPERVYELSPLYAFLASSFAFLLCHMLFVRKLSPNISEGGE